MEEPGHTSKAWMLTLGREKGEKEEGKETRKDKTSDLANPEMLEALSASYLSLEPVYTRILGLNIRHGQ